MKNRSKWMVAVGVAASVATSVGPANGGVALHDQVAIGHAKLSSPVGASATATFVATATGDDRSLTIRLCSAGSCVTDSKALSSEEWTFSRHYLLSKIATTLPILGVVSLEVRPMFTDVLTHSSASTDGSVWTVATATGASTVSQAGTHRGGMIGTWDVTFTEAALAEDVSLVFATS